MTDEKNDFEFLTPTADQKAALAGKPEPQPTPWGNRALARSTASKIVSAFSALWSSRVMLLITILLINGIFIGSYLIGGTVVVRFGKEAQVTPEEAKAAVEQLSNGFSWPGLIGHLIVVLLCIRCLYLMFTSAENPIDNYMTLQR